MTTRPEEAFWSAITAGHQATGRDLTGLSDWLYKNIAAPADDDGLRGYQDALIALVGALNTWQHRAAAELMLGEFSEHLFAAFRCWVVAHGPLVYEQVAEDPDNLVDVEFMPPMPGPNSYFPNLASVVSHCGFMLGALWSNVWFSRHQADTSWPQLESLMTAPSGDRPANASAALVGLPRLSARYARDGLTLTLPDWLPPAEPMQLTRELLVQIHVPLVSVSDEGGEGNAFLDRIEEYLQSGEHGLGGACYDDGEEVGDEYVFLVGNATERKLIAVARKVAALPGVPNGVYAVVSDTLTPIGSGGKRVDL